MRNQENIKFSTFTSPIVAVLLLYYLMFESRWAGSPCETMVSLFCWVSQVGGALHVLKQSLLYKGGSPCGHGLKHYFNYKSVTSLHLLESSVIPTSVFLNQGGTRRLSGSGLS